MRYVIDGGSYNESKVVVITRGVLNTNCVCIKFSLYFGEGGLDGTLSTDGDVDIDGG